jgi:predicted dehydrogenase
MPFSSGGLNLKVMPVQIGFLGAGAQARAHAIALQTLDAEIVAVCDLSAPRAAQFSQDFGAQIFSSPNRMLNGAKLDALYICTPPNVRGPVEIAAAKRGIALFIESPVALNLATARSVANALSKNGVLCSVGSAWRYSESTQRLKKILAPKNAATPLVLAGKWLQTPRDGAWRLDAKQSGGLWLDSGYALLDLARIFGGEVKKVGAFSVANSKSALFQFENGALGNLSVSTGLESGFEREFSVATSEASHIWREANLETRREHETMSFRGKDDANWEQNAAFVRALNSGKKAEIRTSYSEAVKTLRLGLALNRGGA